MQFSVIVPVYNVENYLEECVSSLINQSFQNYEVILVDDGSTDTSGKLCDEIVEKDKRFRVIHKKNEGLVSARRVGIGAAKGEYILFCDSDDWYESNTLEIINEIILKYQADLIVFNAFNCNGNSKSDFSKPVFKDGIIDKTKFINSMFESYALNSMCMKAIRKDIIDIKRDYTEFYKCNFGEDLLQSIPLVVNSRKIFYTSQKLYDYRIASGMMRKYSSNYYLSYRKINQEIYRQLNEINFTNVKEKTNLHLIKVVYGAIIQSQFAASCPTDDWKQIYQDDYFKSAYKFCKDGSIITKMGKKEKIILWLFQKREFRLLYLILKLKNHLGGVMK